MVFQILLIESIILAIIVTVLYGIYIKYTKTPEEFKEWLGSL
jgi:hypothetical protein